MINLTNYKLLLREILKDLKYGEILHSWIVGFNTANMSILSKLTYKFSAFPIKIPTGFFFVEIDKLKFSHNLTNLKICVKMTRS